MGTFLIKISIPNLKQLIFAQIYLTKLKLRFDFRPPPINFITLGNEQLGLFRCDQFFHLLVFGKTRDIDCFEDEYLLFIYSFLKSFFIWVLYLELFSLLVLVGAIIIGFCLTHDLHLRILLIFFVHIQITQYYRFPFL